MTVIARDLRYPHDLPGRAAQEKGIDVALAVDFVVMAVRREYDAGILLLALHVDDEQRYRPGPEVVDQTQPVNRPRARQGGT